MMNLAKAVLQLKNEREQVRRKLEQLDSALSALAGLGGSSGKAGRVQMSGGKNGEPCHWRRGNELRQPSAHVGRSGKLRDETNNGADGYGSESRRRQQVLRGRCEAVTPSRPRCDGESSQVEGTRRHLLI
jgi:hypothetical protein